MNHGKSQTGLVLYTGFSFCKRHRYVLFDFRKIGVPIWNYVENIRVMEGRIHLKGALGLTEDKRCCFGAHIDGIRAETSTPNDLPIFKKKKLWGLSIAAFPKVMVSLSYSLCSLVIVLSLCYLVYFDSFIKIKHFSQSRKFVLR